MVPSGVAATPARPEGDSAMSRAFATPARRALAAFVAVQAIAFVVYLVIGRHVWFFLDEWDFIVTRGVNWHDVTRPHAGHFVALPVLVYRAMYGVFGMRSYLPYQVLIVVLHLTAAGLLRVVMRRAGVGPWMATIASTAYVFFGAAGQDILWAFQITYVGALVLGLTQLLLADLDGTLDRRDWLGLAAGLGAILCSGVGVAMVVVVAIAALLRRGWRAAAFHTIPLSVLYGAWWWTNDRHGVSSARHVSLLDWDRRGLMAALGALGRVPPVGWALAVMLAAGLVFVVRQRQGFRMLRTSAAMPLAMLVGAIVFLTLTGATRAWAGTAYVTSSRYLDVVVALALPAIALAADALVKRSTWLAPIAVALLLVGIPGNIGATTDALPALLVHGDTERTMRSLPYMDLARQVPRTLVPDPDTAPEVTVGWLLDAARAGRLRPLRHLTPSQVATNRLRLSLMQTPGGSGEGCRPLPRIALRTLRRGDAFSVRGTIGVKLRDASGVLSDRLVFGATFRTGFAAQTLRAVGGDLTLYVAPFGGPASLCAPR